MGRLSPADFHTVYGFRRLEVRLCAYGVLQESSVPRADEHAIWDTLRSRKPGSLRAMASQLETSCAI